MNGGERQRPPRLSLPITTDRLLLRDYVEADLDAVNAYQREPTYRRHLPIPVQTLDVTRQYIAEHLSHQAEEDRYVYYLAACLKADGRLVGEGIVKFGAPRHRQAEIGYGLAPELWGRGYGTEIAAALLQTAFAAGCHRVFAMCSVDNAASRRVLQKLGMRREAVLREHFFGESRWWTSCIYGMLATEARAVRPHADAAPSQANES
jgi:RimJ/RimL family protein N-acetyltransferase